MTDYSPTCARGCKRDLGLRPPPSAPCAGGHGGRPRIAEMLNAIAQRLRNLSPDHRDPEKFHIQKSELVAELRRLARMGWELRSNHTTGR